jgi:hypothetical protein
MVGKNQFSVLGRKKIPSDSARGAHMHPQVTPLC